MNMDQEALSQMESPSQGLRLSEIPQGALQTGFWRSGAPVNEGEQISSSDRACRVQIWTAQEPGLICLPIQFYLSQTVFLLYFADPAESFRSRPCGGVWK